MLINIVLILTTVGVVFVALQKLLENHVLRDMYNNPHKYNKFQYPHMKKDFIKSYGTTLNHSHQHLLT